MISVKTEKKREKLLTKGGRAGRIKKLSQKEAEPLKTEQEDEPTKVQGDIKKCDLSKNET